MTASFLTNQADVQSHRGYQFAERSPFPAGAWNVSLLNIAQVWRPTWNWEGDFCLHQDVVRASSGKLCSVWT